MSTRKIVYTSVNKQGGFYHPYPMKTKHQMIWDLIQGRTTARKAARQFCGGASRL